jgi:sulfur relay (sulfurtransferase) complex TusBCD TusD component (DsrE family)
MPKTLFILNDPPYGTERSYNALRLAGSLSKREGEEVKIFLIGDAASCAKKDLRSFRLMPNRRPPQWQGSSAARAGAGDHRPG